MSAAGDLQVRPGGEERIIKKIVVPDREDMSMSEGIGYILLRYHFHAVIV